MEVANAMKLRSRREKWHVLSLSRGSHFESLNGA